VKEHSFEPFDSIGSYYPLIAYLDKINTFECNMLNTPMIKNIWDSGTTYFTPAIELCIIDVSHVEKTASISEL
jgi:hypothetical protein